MYIRFKWVDSEKTDFPASRIVLVLQRNSEWRNIIFTSEKYKLTKGRAEYSIVANIRATSNSLSKMENIQATIQNFVASNIRVRINGRTRLGHIVLLEKRLRALRKDYADCMNTLNEERKSARQRERYSQRIVP